MHHRGRENRGEIGNIVSIGSVHKAPVIDDTWIGTDGIDAIPGRARGSYVLLIELAGEETISVGKRPDIAFFPGYYAYVGSAMNGLKARLARHLRTEKRRHWHIDYLLERASIIDIAVHEADVKLECSIAGVLSSRFAIIPGFGCSDCRCPSHLFFATEERQLRDVIGSLIGGLLTLKT